MGMYDSVWVKCPKCDTENEFQSKSGDCSLDHYTLENCPEDVLINVNRHAPIHCECGTAYSVDMELKKPILVDVPNQNKEIKLITMTEQEAADKIRYLAENEDMEDAHIEADRILCELLTQLGYNKVVEEFEKMDKWYA